MFTIDGPLESAVERVDIYLPRNYRVVSAGEAGDTRGSVFVYIEGEDTAGWTLDGYVFPLLATRGMFGYEVNDQTPEG